VSVLVRLTAERIGLHPVARSCFAPPPNVDSALVAFRRARDWGPELARLREVVQASFAHRRKTLANSLELAGLAGREQAVGALSELGRPANVRAEALEPEELLRLAGLLP
jgi:16S rRNA (adenine1518-N6/adenine1519-N6)-dimethyltransferase